MGNKQEAPVYHPLKPLIDHRKDAMDKAFKALSQYKFAMFGYWAGIWVHMNRCIAEQDPGLKNANPFSFLVKSARKVMEDWNEHTI